MPLESVLGSTSDISSETSVLPNELLLRIFEIVYFDKKDSFKTSLILSHVSRQWRDVAINHRLLWSRLEVRYLREANLIPLFAHRSGHNRFQLSFFKAPSAESAWTSQNIVLEPSDVRFISDLVFGEVNSLHVFIAEKAFHGELDLQTISITDADKFCPELCLSAHRIDLYASYMEPSKDASLLFPNLTDLRLAVHRLSHLNRTFSSMEGPLLQTITFYEITPEEDEEASEVAPASATRFPRLRKVVFEGCGPSAWSSFTQSLGDTTTFIRELDIFPDHLWLWLPRPHILVQPLCGALQNFSSLQSLTLRTLGSAVLDVLGVLAPQSTGIVLVPRLTSLRVVLEPVQQKYNYRENRLPPEAASQIPSLLEGRCAGRPLHLNDTAILDELILPLRLAAGHEEWYHTRVSRFTTEDTSAGSS
ncbi:hypothetical protein DL93DRAFT_2232806 [Clavulina sp. PMI_390]|nr:hypothetical protein DL93DRAFT_2232806 [Clavulina sp. PMI_390]